MSSSSSSPPTTSDQPCQSHSLFINDTCKVCKAAKDSSTQTVPIHYICKDLSITLEERDRRRDSNFEHFMRHKKLHLVLDLDHTLIHSEPLHKVKSADPEFLERIKDDDYKTRRSKGLHMRARWVTKIRPDARAFLKEVSSMFNLSIYTMATRKYALDKARILDPKGLYIHSESVISREDCTTKDRKGLNVLLSHERIVVVVDDTLRVWESHPRNLIKIAPYKFFAVENRTHLMKSWTELKGDESEEYGELARILRMLRNVHSKFFDLGDGNVDSLDYENRDVREVIDEVEKEFLTEYRNVSSIV